MYCRVDQTQNPATISSVYTSVPGISQYNSVTSSNVSNTHYISTVPPNVSNQKKSETPQVRRDLKPKHLVKQNSGSSTEIYAIESRISEIDKQIQTCALAIKNIVQHSPNFVADNDFHSYTRESNRLVEEKKKLEAHKIRLSKSDSGEDLHKQIKYPPNMQTPQSNEMLNNRSLKL